MPRSALSIQQPSLAGLDLVAGSANVDGHAVPGTADVLVKVINGSAAPITVSIPPTETFDGLTLSNGGGPVPAGATRYFGPFRARLFNQTDGTVWINYSAVASVTVAALRLVRP
jgi:hypothetical protein